MAYKGKLTKWQRMSLFCSGYFNKGSNHDMNNPIDKDHIDFIAHKIEKLCEGNQIDLKDGNCTIFDVRQRCIDFANWIKKQNLMICTGYDESDCNWRSSMIGGKKFTDEQLYDIFERGGNVT